MRRTLQRLVAVHRRPPPTVTTLEVFRLLETERGLDLVEDRLENAFDPRPAGPDRGRWMSPARLERELARGRFDFEVHQAQPWDGRSREVPISRRSLPAAVTRALDPKGTGSVSRDALAERYGKWGRDYYDTLARRIRAEAPPARFTQSDFRAFAQGCHRAFFEPLGDLLFRDRMPSLFKLARRAGPNAFVGREVLALQHLLPSTQGLFQAIAEGGVDRLAYRGKPYSTHSAFEPIARALRAEGVPLDGRADPDFAGWDVDKQGRLYLNEHPLELPAPGDSSGWLTFAAAVDLFHLLRHVPVPNGVPAQRPYLLLDEGGHLATALHTFFPEFEPLFACVEQTEYGARKVAQMTGLRFPVINVAQSWAKKDFESPAIGESVVYHLESYLAEMSPQHRLRKKEAAVLGNGAVGRATAAALHRRGYQVWLYDVDPAQITPEDRERYHVESREKVLSHGHLVVSCTGEPALGPEDFDHLPEGAVLTNAATGNHEIALSPEEQRTAEARDGSTSCGADGALRGTFQGKPALLGRSSDPDRQHRILRTPGGKQLLLLRSGYVINMEVGMPPEYAQHILALLFAGLLQARGEQQVGLVDLQGRYQEQVTARTRAHLERIGQSMEAPDFQALQPWNI